MARRQRITCTCGTRIRLAKGQPLPPCVHLAQTLAKDPDLARGPADYFKFFTPRLPKDHERVVDPASVGPRGASGTGGGQHLKSKGTGYTGQPLKGLAEDHDTSRGKYVEGFKKGQGPPSEKNWKPNPIGSIRDQREARQLTSQIHQREVRRREWAAILPWLGQATDLQRETYRRHIEHGMSYKAIADMDEVSEDAIKARLKAARRHEQNSRRRAQIA